MRITCLKVNCFSISVVEEITEEVEVAQLEQLEKEIEKAVEKLGPLEPIMPIYEVQDNGDIEMNTPFRESHSKERSSLRR